MALQEALQRVQEDIAAGNLGRARDRLHGLVWQYPNDLSLRARLAEVYWQLQFPAMAGCYWYLHEPTTEAMRHAIAEFERSCKGDPLHMLLRLKFRGNPKELPPYARHQLERLQQQCQRKYGKYPIFQAKSKQFTSPNWQHRLATGGCILALIALFGLALLGAGVVLQQAIRLGQHLFR